MLRNHKWYELMEETEELLKNFENIEVKEVHDWQTKLDGIRYDTGLRLGGIRGFSFISLTVYPLENGAKYILNTHKNDFTNGKHFGGILTVVKDKDKISFSREYDFLKAEDDKPATIDYIKNHVRDTLKQIKVLHKLPSLYEETYNNTWLLTDYLKIKKIDITGDESEEDIKEIVDNSQKMERADAYYDLTEKVLREHFNCKDEDHFDAIYLNISDRESFVRNCIKHGVLKDYAYIDYDHFYKLNEA